MAHNGSKSCFLNDIVDLRKTIDEIDEKILDWVNHRLSIAIQIGRCKQKTGDPVIDNAREKAILDRLEMKNPGPLSAPDVRRLFSTIIAFSRAIQKKQDKIQETMGNSPPFPFSFDPPERLNSQTLLLGLFGDPIAHSLSPVMQNRAMRVMGINGVYLPFEIKNLEAAITSLRTLNMRGASVTIPYKTAVMAYLDDADALAGRIGAVNTLCNDRGRVVGWNTDCEAAVTALTEKTDIKGKTVAIIGAGGAAQAIGFGIARAGARPIVYNRSKERGEALAVRLGADYRPLAEFGQRDYHILINTTPVGMWPHVESMPVRENTIRKNTIVMDIIYNPVRTKLLQAAARKEAVPIDGATMFVLQGARQFQLWTGVDAPLKEMRAAVLEALQAGRRALPG